ncbi:P-loop containing nucleoside triphosphate hydrolase protein, partial [Coniella lustricola]
YVRLANLSAVKCDTEAFKYLVLDAEVKQSVKALTGKFARPAATAAPASTSGNKPQPQSHDDTVVSPWPHDFIRNKGQGRIFLLHGSPGVGKTCTAECVAELTRRPLVSLTSGDLGPSTPSLEKRLAYFLALGERYGAVVLLDEADIYLQARGTTQDLERNALVSVFLRALEYYKGVLFLTTNRVEIIDPAFQSRIHVALYYRELADEDRAKIWTHSFERLERDSEGKVAVLSSAMNYVLEQDGKKSEVAALNWNGREIRNALQTAVALAETEALDEGLEKVGVADRHLKQVAKMSKGFRDFLHREK